jgi:hypothetical protein
MQPLGVDRASARSPARLRDARPRTRAGLRRAEVVGLDYGYAFALVNIAWAPGQARGAAIGGAVASVTGDAVAYLGLSALCC